MQWLPSGISYIPLYLELDVLALPTVAGNLIHILLSVTWCDVVWEGLHGIFHVSVILPIQASVATAFAELRLEPGASHGWVRAKPKLEYPKLAKSQVI
jgi:hypothetical protein